MDQLPGWARVTLLAVAAVTVVLVLAWSSYRLRRAPIDDQTALPHRLHRAIGRPWLALTAATLLLVWGLVAAAAPSLTPGWQSTAVVALIPRDPYRTDAQTLTLLGPRYVALLESPRLLSDAAEKTGTSADELLEGVVGEMEPETLVLRVHFSGANAEESAQGANALAAALVQESRGDALANARIIGDAVQPAQRSSPSIDQLVGLGWAAGLVAAIFVGLRTRLRGR